MYQNKLVASLKANGKILREFKDTVYIPFGSEYSILLKNLDTRRVLLNIYIDGDNITPNGFVLYGGQEVDLERSIKNNNLFEGNKFKFIERTGSIEKNRGIKLEDGLIRIEYQFEYVYPATLTSTWSGHNGWINNSNHDKYNTFLRNTTADYHPQNCGVSYSAISASTSLNATSSITDTVFVNSASVVNDAGITVAGSHSTQKFNTASSFPTEATKHSIVLKLLGETEDNKKIVEPVTVKSKPKCVTCGKQNKATSKFCVECGTSLTIFG